MRIKLIVYDFDGVMTDNKVVIFPDGTECVVCNRSDGLAIQKFKELGINQIILTSENNDIVKVRAKKLGIKVIGLINNDKKATLIRYCTERKICLKTVMYVGNDLNDLDAMKIVGTAVCPTDADNSIKEISKYITIAKGGEGVIREVYNIL
jgi:YrbI family 3-deoxy-D-manno-octulosonate 8-phosphate phosphatase